MKGKKVPRGFGWDCHGLPIESLVQNELGLAGVAEIQKLGVDKFNETCRGKVLKYTSEWKKTVRRMGRWVELQQGCKPVQLGNENASVFASLASMAFELRNQPGL